MGVNCLFVTHKWGDALPGTGDSVTIPHLINTFEEWGGGRSASVWTDVCFHEGGDVVAEVEAAIAALDPQIIVYTPIPGVELESQNISPEQMRRFGRKAISVFFDLTQPECRRHSQKYADASFLSVNIDGYDEPIAERFLSLWPACTRRLSVEKDIDASFLGGKNSYPDRMEALALLRREGIPVLVSGGRAETPHTSDDYFDILDRSLLALNFSKTVHGDTQIKARVFEALSAGCCVVEDMNTITPKYLRPGIDYLTWNRVDDLPDLLRRLLADRTRANRIAANGKAVFEARYSASRFWEAVIAACGDDAPVASASLPRHWFDSLLNRFRSNRRAV